MRRQSIFVCLILSILSQVTQGRLLFRNPPHTPRIYASAPDGVYVTTVQAYDPDLPFRKVTYSLLDVKDRVQFAVQPDTGNLTTAAPIQKEVGFIFHVIVVALSQGMSQLCKLQVIVSDFNRHPPVFQHNQYRGELHIMAPVGTPVLAVDATDQDVVPYNAEVSYKLDNNASSGYFEIDPENGQIRLARPLSTPIAALTQNPNAINTGLSSNLIFGVLAQDGGSPARWAHARIQVHVRNLSEPVNVRSANPTDTTVDVCWSHPMYGQPLGYLIKYRQLVSGGTVEVTSNSYILNVTTKASSKCITISKLRPWTDYQYRVYAWNHLETGIASHVGTMGTKPNYCATNVCKQGTCQPLNVEPGYWCECPKGYYGATCDLFNPCSLSPCHNFGVCRNTSHNEYHCECLSGFSGQNCSQFNPCAIRPSPCLNSGQCESSASHTFNCKCKEGFYGKTCKSYNPCVSSPCANGALCHNTTSSEYACTCKPGFSGLNCEWNVDDCTSSPCANGATCVDQVNGFQCICPPGLESHDCSKPMQCPREVTKSEKGVLVWEATDHGDVARAPCPFGFRPWQGTGTAKRRCRLLPSGEVAWSKVQDHHCREETFHMAEILTERLEQMTYDPSNLTSGEVQEAVNKMMELVDPAAKDPKVAQSLFNVVSNLMLVNASILEVNDSAQMVLKVVDRFMSEVQLEPGRPVEIQTDNLALKAVALEIKDGAPQKSELTQALTFKSLGPVAEKRVSSKQDGNHIQDQAEPRTMEKGKRITIPVEALDQFDWERSEATEVRLSFVSYRTARLFQDGVHNLQEQTNRKDYHCQDPQTGVQYFVQEAGVLQASIHSTTVQNLTHPVVYVMPAPACLKPRCVYWNPKEKSWSTEGLWTNVTGNTTICYSSHLTAFSILFDLDPEVRIPAKHRIPLTVISYLGSSLSIIGLLITITTYTLFRCLHRDRSSKILLNLCASLLLLNVSFLAGSQRGLVLFNNLDICVLVAVLLHYFLLTSLTWMGLEALNMYQLLIYVFASSESRFMLKRCLIGWGFPLIIVGITVFIRGEEYFRQNEYCMLSSVNPYVYYASFLGPSCLILALNLTVFIMVSRVLLAPQRTNASSLQKSTVIGNSSSGQQVVTLAQVKGAFTVMVLLGVTWVFGAFALGEFKLVFQYFFCICNSLQGFLIFVVRCLCYPEARVAWAQLFRTGTLKKHRSVVPPATGSCYANSSSNQYKPAVPKPRSVRAGSHDSAATNSVFSSNYWKNNPRLSQNLRSTMGDQDAGWNRSCLTFAPLASSVHSITSGESSLDRMSTTNFVEDDDDQGIRTESSSDTSSYHRRLTLPLVPGIDISSQSSDCTRSSTVCAVGSPPCSICGMTGCSESEHSDQADGEVSYISI